MRSATSHIVIILIAVGALLLLTQTPPVYAQQAHTMLLRGVPLDEALEAFVDQTGLAVAYDPALVQPEMVYCTAQELEAEAVLQCILRRTGLDFVRLSSGTYVIVPAAELAPIYGFLSGRVVDQASGSPLPNAHVLLTGVGVGTVTNTSGQFILPELLPGRYAVAVSHIGYRRWVDTLIVAAGNRTEAWPALRSEPVTSKPLVVTGAAERFSTQMQSGVSAVDIRSPQHWGSGIRGSLLSALSSMSGVRLNDATSEVHVQGAASGEHRFELDGVPVFSPFYSLGYVGPFSPFALDKVTVHKAGYGAEQGSQIAGLISATHRVEGPERADILVDPLGFNASLRGKARLRGTTTASGMVTARIGMSNWPGVDRAEQFLAALGSTDPFLVFAPVRIFDDSRTPGQADPDFGLNSDALTDDSARAPDLSYSDVHGAVRVGFGALKTLSVSGYHGSTSLSGGLIERAELAAEFIPGPPPVSAFDEYKSNNTIGQARFDMVLGTRALWSTQVRGSRFSLNHNYLLADSLALSPSGQLRTSNLELTGITDTDNISEWAIESSMDIALRSHSIKVGLEALATDTRFSLLMAGLPPTRNSTGPAEQLVSFSVVRDTLAVDAIRHRIGGYLSDRIRLGNYVAADAGLRMTYLPSHQDVFAEPRLSVHIEGENNGPLMWSLSGSAGLYRQFLGQYDVSALNAGALLPSMRVWLPVDESVRPPLAYHLSELLRLATKDGWSVEWDAYLKWIPHGLTLDYALQQTLLEDGPLHDQFSFLTSYSGRARGLSTTVQRRTNTIHLKLRHEWMSVKRSSETLFGGEEHAAPWEEPHRIDLAFDWKPSQALHLGARWQGIWGRAWGFKQAYYDYFGHRWDTMDASGFDLGNPSAHTLPAFRQLDVSFGYTFPVGKAVAQARIDVLNVLNAENVLDWRLVPKQEPGITAGELTPTTDWEIRERYWYGRIPTASLRVTL